METQMLLEDYVKAFRDHWYCLVSGLLLGLLAALGAIELSTDSFTARAQLYVTTQGAGNAADALSANSYVAARVASYASLAQSPIVLRPVIKSLGLDQTTAELASSVRTSIPVNTLLINIDVVNTRSGVAASTANAVAVQLAATLAGLDRSALGRGVALDVVQTQSANLSVTQSSTSPVFKLVLGAFIGGLIGVGAALAWFRLRVVLSSNQRSHVRGHVTSRLGTKSPDEERIRSAG
jgi:succinoglycan biosynthesis transport protein ExoP